jgi:nucleoside-diphosphate-sugar epimerase
VPWLKRAKLDVIAVDRKDGDVTALPTWEGFPAADVVIHLAAKSFVPDSWVDPVGFIQTNVLGTTFALNYARTNNAHLIYLSSYLYGDPDRLPIPESAPIAAKSPYALSKLLSESTCRYFSESFGIRVTILRPFNVYGPGQSPSFLVPSIVRQVEEGGPIRVKDLEPRRDFVYVGDLITAITAAMGFTGRYGVFNVGSGQSHSVQELIDIVQRAWQTQYPVITKGERRKDEIMDTVADISAARRVLRWSPEWNLPRGVAEMRSLGERTSERNARADSQFPA